MADIHLIVLQSLEWLAKYGFIDIILAAGLFGALRRLLVSRSVSHIDGVEVLISVLDDRLLKIEVQNLTAQPLYIYRQYFRPGYFLSYSEGGWRTLLFYQWSNESCLKFSNEQPSNYKGDFLLQAFDKSRGKTPSAFVEPRENVTYEIPLAEEKKDVHSRIIRGRVGTLTLHLVHGTEAKVLAVQL